MSERHELSDLGEFGLIDKITSDTKIHHKSTHKAVGDDAAVVGTGDIKTVISTDTLVEGIHFDLSYVPLMHLGYKAVAISLSDVLSMNVKPTQVLVSISVSNRFSIEAIEELYKGIHKCCEIYKVDLVGGDTTSSSSGLMINVTALGESSLDHIVYRNGANEHDVLCVTGDLGSAYMGLQILEREKFVYKDNPNVQPDLEGKDYLLERQLKPEPRADLIRLFEEHGIKPTAMIDISDGLASEVMHLCHESKRGAQLYEDKIPVDPLTAITADEMQINAMTAALNGGEDYEMLFSIRGDDYEKIKDFKEVSVIGHFTGEGETAQLVTNANQVVELKAQGWNAFPK